jgi:phosphoribosyl-ATP pyrophosphohydrolase/phosphoribosyl-AMP cyclohydrolase
MRKKPDFSKCEGLLPAIVQDARSGEVLMLGYMNEEAYGITLEKGLVTFFSRSKGRLWMKGESSGNVLRLKDISCDCDSDALLVLALPDGPTCHEGSQSCFANSRQVDLSVLTAVAETISHRRNAPVTESYTAALFAQGIDKIVQKVGEEGVEVVIEGKNGDRDRLLNESADLMFHLLILLEARGLSLGDVCRVLQQRSRPG